MYIEYLSELRGVYAYVCIYMYIEYLWWRGSLHMYIYMYIEYLSEFRGVNAYVYRVLE